MPTPPTPFIPGILLTVAAKLGFRLVARGPAGTELGTFTDGTIDHPLLLAGAASSGAVEWTLLDTTPVGFGLFLLARDTYDVLHSGVLQRDGSIGFQGQSYQIQSYFDGAQWTARAISVTLAA